MSAAKCPSRDELFDYAVGALSEDDAESMVSHLTECPDCEATLLSLDEAEDTLMGHLRTPAVDDAYLEESRCDEAVVRAKAAADLQTLADGVTLGGAEAPAGDLGRIGEYQLTEKLGQGGMGMVYKAMHGKLRRTVALKVLPSNRTNDRQAVARFEREMAAVGGLDHPHIVRATHAGEHEGTSYLVMEYVEGLDLSELARRCGPLPVADACELIRQAAVGLQHAHENGLVHRDVKPSNLMLGCDGRVKILDLGLALLQEDRPAAEEVTGAGQAMGTADYISPEQISDSHTVDIRADVYSLGCTLYKLLAGRAPYSGAKYHGAFEKMMGHARDPVPSIKDLRRGLPERLVAVIERMLSKAPGDRPATPDAVAEAMGPFAREADLPQLIQWAEARVASPSAPTEPLDGTAEYVSSAVAVSGPDTAPYACYRRAQPSARRWHRRPAVLVGLAAAAVLVFGAIFTVVTNRGTLEIKTFDEDVEVSILQDGREITILDTKTGNKVTLYAGEYQLKLSGEKGDLQLSTDTFTLRRGEKVIVEVRRRPSIAVPEPPTVTVQLRATLRGHTADVRSVAVSPQGKTLATASFDGTVKLWDMASRKELATLQGHTGKINCVVFSSDGKMLASAGTNDNVVKLWDVATAKELSTLEGHTGAVYSAAFAPNGGTVASGSADGTVKIWDVAKGTEFATLEGHTQQVEVVAFSPHGKLLASGSWDGTVKFWDTVTWKEQATLQAADDIRWVTFSPDGETLATGSADGAIKLWDVATRKARTAWQAHAWKIRRLAFTPDGKLLASSSQDGSFKIWDASTGAILAVYPERHQVWNVAFSRDGLTLITASSDGTVKLWDVSKGPTPRERVWPKSSSPRLYTISHKGELVRIDVVGKGFESRVVKSLGTEFEAVEGLTMTDGLLYAAANYADDESRLYAIHVETGEVSARGSLGVRQVDGLAWSDGALFGVTSILGGAEAARLIYIDPQSGKTRPIGKPLKLRDLDSLTFDDRGRLLTTDGIGRVDMFYELDRRGISAPKSLAPTPAITVSRDIEGLAMGTDGMLYGVTHPGSTAGHVSYLVRINPETFQHENLGSLGFGAMSITAENVSGTVSPTDKTVTARLRATLTGHSGYLSSVAVSPDGKMLASGSFDQTVKLWDVETGQMLDTLTGHTKAVYSVAFSPDGKTLASASVDNTVILWDLATKEPKTTFTARANCVAFCGDGKTLAASTMDGTVMLWDLAGSELKTTLRTPIWSLTFSPDGKTLALGGMEGNVQLWDALGEKQRQTFTAHTGIVCSVAFSPDGTILATSSKDGTVKLWDAATGKQRAALKGHTHEVHHVAFSPDGKILASASEDKTLKLWDAETGKELTTLTGHTAGLWSLALTPDGKTLASAGDKTIKLWDVSKVTSTSQPSLQGETQQPPVLKHTQPTVMGTDSHRRVGFAKPIRARFQSATVQFHVEPNVAAPQQLAVTRLFFCRQDTVPSGPDSKLYRNRQVDLWVPVPDGPYAQVVVDDTRKDKDFSRLRPARSLPDGVYCLHTGSLTDSKEVPQFCAPFIVRGYGEPEIERTEVELKGKVVTLRVVIHNAGGGQFNDGLLIATLQKKEQHRPRFKQRRNLTMEPVPARGRTTVETMFNANDWEPGTYYFHGHVNYRHLWDANRLCSFNTDEFVIPQWQGRPQPAEPSETIRSFGEVKTVNTISKDGVEVDQKAWRIKAQKPRTVRLFEVPEPGVENCLLAYRAKIKTEDLEGRAYLEVWCRVAGIGESFSKYRGQTLNIQFNLLPRSIVRASPAFFATWDSPARDPGETADAPFTRPWS